MITEKRVEQYLVEEVRKLGGHAYKFKSPGQISVPDRICVFPSRLVVFVECKKPGADPTTSQKEELKKLAGLGQYVAVANSFSEVDRIIEDVKAILAFDI